MMLTLPNLLLIAGNARNTGKTSLSCEILRRFGQSHSIIGLKLTRMKSGEEQFHGHHSEPAPDSFSISEESNLTGDKDTSKMLASGASKAFYIQAQDDQVVNAFESFYKSIPENSLILCESRSLREFITPGIFILMMRSEPIEKLKDVSHFLEIADIICFKGDNMKEIKHIVKHLQINQSTWNFL